MDWKKLLSELGESMTLQQIADASGLSSKGHVHSILTGELKTVRYEVGLKLVALHKKVMRKRAKQKLKA